MKKHLRFLFCIGFIVALPFLLCANSWAGPLNFWEYSGETSVSIGYYVEIGETTENFGGYNPGQGEYSAHKDLYVPYFLCCEGEAWRDLDEAVDLSIEMTDAGFNISLDMTLATYYDYNPGYEPDPVGFARAYTSGGTYITTGLTLPATAEVPLGTVVPFVIQIETSGTPWETSEWELTIGSVTVNQDNYDQQVFNLVAGDVYSFLFKSRGGFQTQDLVEGYLESGFDLNFEQVLTPVPIPGAIWLLGSGLVGLIGLRRKYLS